jgi:hypothetical protein
VLDIFRVKKPVIFKLMALAGSTQLTWVNGNTQSCDTGPIIDLYGEYAGGTPVCLHTHATWTPARFVARGAHPIYRLYLTWPRQPIRQLPQFAAVGNTEIMTADGRLTALGSLPVGTVLAAACVMGGADPRAGTPTVSRVECTRDQPTYSVELSLPGVDVDSPERVFACCGVWVKGA